MIPPDFRRYDPKSTRHDQIFNWPDADPGQTIAPPGGMIPWDEEYGVILNRVMSPDPKKEPLNFLKNYKDAFREWLSQIFVVGGNQIPVFETTPKKAFAEYWHVLPDKIKSAYLSKCGEKVSEPLTRDQKNTPPASLKLASYPLPFVSYSAAGMNPADSRNSSARLRNVGYFDINRKTTGHLAHPVPWDIEFNINVWNKYKSFHDFMIALFTQSFRQEQATTSIKNPIFGDGERLLSSIFWGSFSDNTDLEESEEEELIYRATYTVKMEAMQFEDLRSAPVAQKISISVSTLTEGMEELAEVALDEKPAESPTGDNVDQMDQMD